eukprot:3963397-Amphidinium_carterae.2
MHAGHVLTYYRITNVGRTPYEQSRGRKMQKPILTFGEGCLYRPLGALARKLDARWEIGVYLTTLEHSIEHVIGLSNGDVGKCRDIKPLPGAEGEVSKQLLDLKGLPWQPRHSDEVLDIGDADAT